MDFIPQRWEEGKQIGIYYDALMSPTSRWQQGGTEAIKGEDSHPDRPFMEKWVKAQECVSSAYP